MRRLRTVFELLVPDGYEIEARRLNGDTWIMEYTEQFSEEKWEKGLESKDHIIDNIKRLLGDTGSLWVDEENMSLTLKIQGPQKLIFNMLVGEFIAGSNLGEMKLKDILGLAAMNVLPHIKKLEREATQATT